MNNYVEKTRGVLTSHKLKDFAVDPYSYKLKYIDELDPPYRARHPEEEKDAFIIGRAVDDLFTEGKDYFDSHYIQVDRRIDDVEAELASIAEKLKEAKPGLKTTKALQAKEKMILSLRGKTQLTPSMMGSVTECALEYDANSLLGVYTNAKEKYFMPFQGSSLPLGGEVDYCSEDKKVIRDLKTCANLDQFDPLTYQWQMAFYHWLHEEAYNTRPEVYLDVIEKPTPSRPFSRSKVFRFTDLTLLEVRPRILETIIQHERCYKSGIWPKASPEVAFQSEYYGYEGYGRPTDIITI